MITKCQISADANNYDLRNVEYQSLVTSCEGLQTFRLRSHVIVASQWEVNPTLTVHAVFCYSVVPLLVFFQ